MPRTPTSTLHSPSLAGLSLLGDNDVLDATYHAQGLCFELGVFDKDHYDCQNNHDPTSDCARKMRVRRLVLIYIFSVQRTSWLAF